MCICIEETLSETQMQNARATGYAIVAAKNQESIFYLCNSGWHQ